LQEVHLKIAILGAGGVRTPLIVEALARRQKRIGLAELALMDVDAERLEIIGWLTDPLTQSGGPQFKVLRTTDARAALAGADFVITTFRVGGIASRVVDERVPLRHGVLGQETTGPGGFAMAMRTIPVLLDYLRLMREQCPDAWLVNFANPAGLLAEAAVRSGGWERTVGICDAPMSMQRVGAALLGVPSDELYLDYFGLNHLGWVRAALHDGRNHLPQFIEMIRRMGSLSGLPFDGEFLAELGMIPNEYLFYYYRSREAVANILAAGQTRGEQIAAWNAQLFDALGRQRAAGDIEGMGRTYRAYIERRGDTYMTGETGQRHNLDRLPPDVLEAVVGEGYAGVALDLIEGLIGIRPRPMILNVPNRGAIHGMGTDDVVEVPAYVGKGHVWPMAVGAVPAGPLGLMQQVKAYERLTISAAAERSYAKAVQALVVHPLVQDFGIAKAILDGYREGQGPWFPALS
jgi:6-phospho-beta-glucosidase